jgi:hypothetical protein
LLAELIADQFHVALPVVVSKPRTGKLPSWWESYVSTDRRRGAQVHFSTDPGPEGYFLRVDDNGVVVAGCDYRGAFMVCRLSFS